MTVVIATAHWLGWHARAPTHSYITRTPPTHKHARAGRRQSMAGRRARRPTCARSLVPAPPRSSSSTRSCVTSSRCAFLINLAALLGGRLPPPWSVKPPLSDAHREWGAQGVAGVPVQAGTCVWNVTRMWQWVEEAIQQVPGLLRCCCFSARPDAPTPLKCGLTCCAPSRALDEPPIACRHLEVCMYRIWWRQIPAKQEEFVQPFRAQEQERERAEREARHKQKEQAEKRLAGHDWETLPNLAPLRAGVLCVVVMEHEGSGSRISCAWNYNGAPGMNAHDERLTNPL